MPPSQPASTKFTAPRALGQWRRVKSYLFPHKAEQDDGFRQEVERLSIRSLFVIAGVEFVMPLLGQLFHYAADLIEPLPRPGNMALPGLTLIAAATFGAGRTAWGRERARGLGLLSGFFAGAVLFWNQFLYGPVPAEAELSAGISFVVVMLVGVAAVPSLPIQVFSLGVALSFFFWGSALFAVRWGLIPGSSLHHYVGFDMVTLLCTALSAVNYHRLHEAYESQKHNVEARSRLLLSEHAASMGRFSAALSHQMNTPIGVLKSAVDSLRTAAARKAGATGKERERIEEVEAELRDNAARSIESLQDTVDRMQRFTNLDRAEVMQVDLASLLRNVTTMAEPEARGKVRFELILDAAPALTLNPQQVSAVFSNLLHNAVSGSRDGGRVAIETRTVEARVDVIVRDAGRGLHPDELAVAFEPGFRVRNGQVGAAWGLFSSRQIVREHGGDMQIRSEPGGGTEVTVSLPLGPDLGLARF